MGVDVVLRRDDIRGLRGRRGLVTLRDVLRMCHDERDEGRGKRDGKSGGRKTVTR